MKSIIKLVAVFSLISLNNLLASDLERNVQNSSSEVESKTDENSFPSIKDRIKYFQSKIDQTKYSKSDATIPTNFSDKNKEESKISHDSRSTADSNDSKLVEGTKNALLQAPEGSANTPEENKPEQGEENETKKKSSPVSWIKQAASKLTKKITPRKTKNNQEEEQSGPSNNEREHHLESDQGSVQKRVDTSNPSPSLKENSNNLEKPDLLSNIETKEDSKGGGQTSASGLNEVKEEVSDSLGKEKEVGVGALSEKRGRDSLSG